VLAAVDVVDFILALYAAVANVDDSVEEATRDLGGTPLRTFRAVAFPISRTIVRVRRSFSSLGAVGPHSAPHLADGFGSTFGSTTPPNRIRKPLPSEVGRVWSGLDD